MILADRAEERASEAAAGAEGGRRRERRSCCPAADLGRDRVARAHRPGVVHDRGLVRDLPRRQGLRPRADGGRLLGAVPRRRPRQLLRAAACRARSSAAGGRWAARASSVIVAGGLGVLALVARGVRRRASRCCSRASRSRPSRMRRCRRWRSRCPPTSSRAARWRSVAGMAGTGAGARHDRLDVPHRRRSPTASPSRPILLVASVVPLARGAAVVLSLVRNTAASGRGLVKVI